MNENTPGFSLSGFLIIMLMPVFIKGLVKSTARCLSSLMVKGAMAMSAFYNSIVIYIIITYELCNEMANTSMCIKITLF
jgi:hypothetical protein